MNKQLETEILGFISSAQYKALLKRLNVSYGEGATTKRLSLQVMDYSRTDIDTRIRVTNGNAEIMQKTGSWESDTRQEVSIDIQNTVQSVIGHWHILSNLLEGTHRKRTIIQTESTSYIVNDEFEVKITHQFGGVDVYSYEIESLKAGVDPRPTAKSLKIPIDTIPKDSKFWEEFNNRVNIDADSLTELELRSIVERYLGPNR